jgi:3',5'-cyclic AMP phosphodiesterase CpdA
MSSAALLAAGMWPGALAAQDAASNDFPFICVNDLHFFDDKCIPFFQDAITKMKAASPDSKLLLVVGDLVDEGKPAQFDKIRELLKSSGMTFKVVCGNHDWVSDTDRKAYEQSCPDSLNYTFDNNGWQFVALDSSDGTKFSNTNILKPTLDWVDQNLPKLDKIRPMVLMTHFPLGPGVTNRPLNADNLLDRFRNYNIRAIFNGHYHAFTERQRRDFVITTDKCCSFHRNNHDNTPEKGFFACQAQDGKIIRKFVQVNAAPSTKPA